MHAQMDECMNGGLTDCRQQQGILCIRQLDKTGEERAANPLYLYCDLRLISM